MGSSKVKSRSNKVSTEKKKKKKKTGIHEEKKTSIIHKCIAQVSPTDFALSHYERGFSRWLLREEREMNPKMEFTRQVVQGHKISNKILMLTMKRMAQRQGLPVGGVPPPSVFELDSKKFIKELNENNDASSKVPPKLVNFLTMELNTRFDPSLHYMVGVLRKYICLEIVKKAPVPLVGSCLTEEDVVARLVEEFGLLSFTRPEDVLRDVVQKCFVAFQMLEAEAVVLEQMCFN